MDFVASFLGRNGFLPHGTCFTWSPAVLWTMVGSDLAIAAAYFSIPLAIGRFVRQRADPAMNVKVAWLFSTFIFACGVTHVAHVWTVWFPDYGWEALTKLFTASVSVVTAFALWPLLPKAIALPKVGELQAVIAQLQAEAARRRSAEEHLLDSENALAVTLASIDAGFIVTDREGHVTQMNSVAEQLTGWPRSEALGRALWDVFVREDRPAEYLHQSPVDVMLQQDLSVETAHHIVAIARDGRRAAVEVKANVTYNEDGSVRGLVMVTRDLTAALKAQAESSRLAAVVSSSQDAIITKTLDGRITSWNAAATRLFGYTEDEALGQPIQILMPDERKAEELRIIALVAHGEHVPPFDTVRRARDGQLKEVSVSVSPLRDREGRIVGASKIARDISEHHRALRSLRESRERLDFILDAVQIGDWELDFQTQTIKRSLRHDRCFGYETLQAEWTVQLLLAHVHDEDRAGTALALQRAIATGAPLRLTCRVLWPDQSVHWVGMQGAMKSTDDTRASMLGIVMDITESKQAEQARLSAQHLEAELRQVQATSRVKSQFLTNMSHELRTPLNAIIGFSELLQSGMAEGKPAKQELFLKHIADSGHHLLHLINDLLDLSKVDAGKFTFNPDFVALPALVADVVSALQPAVQQGKLRIDMAIDPAIGEVFIDPVRLRQVLYNLVSNAIKFTPAGGRVAIRAQVEADAWFRLEVEDTGVGIAATDMARMFSEFEQLNAGKARQQVGTGLGLALTRRLVEAQGGSVTLRSVVDQGTTFCVVLPRAAPGGASAADQAPPLASDANASTQRLLVIEDDHAARHRLVQVLRQAGFEVDAAFDGEGALGHAHGQRYDGLTLDLLIRDASGAGVLAGIRAQGATSTSPVVSVSVSADVGETASFAVTDVLAKPMRQQEISLALERLPKPAGRRLRVLVVDDDAKAVALMESFLQDLDVEAQSVTDGRSALKRVVEDEFDAMVLDLLMPEFDGFQVLAELRRLPQGRLLPVFIWTSMVLSHEEHATLARSARAVLSKGGGDIQEMLPDLVRWLSLNRIAPPRPLAEGESSKAH